MSDLSQLPPLHPKRVTHAVGILEQLPEDKKSLSSESALKALEVVQKLQTGFGFAPDLYDKVEMAKSTVEQGRTVFGALKALMNRK